MGGRKQQSLFCLRLDQLVRELWLHLLLPLTLPSCNPPPAQLLDCPPAPLVMSALLGLLRAPFTRSELSGEASSSNTSTGTGTGTPAPPLGPPARALFLHDLLKQLIRSVALFRRGQVGVHLR